MPPPVGELRRIALGELDVPQARIRKDLGAVADLAYSLGSVGLLHPIQVYAARGRYRLIAGERRLEAAKRLGWTHIDALVREPRDDDLLLELIENTQRKWLSDAEEADALIRLVREKGRELKEVAAQAGRSEAFVSKRIRVFEDPALRSAVEQGDLPVSVAEEFLALSGPERRVLLEQAVAGGWDGRRVRQAIRALTRPEAAEAAEGAEVPAEHQPAAGAVARPADLTRQIRTLERALRDLRPYQLTRRDEQALAALLTTLLRLARAHARAGGRPGPVFPSLEEAERAARHR